MSDLISRSETYKELISRIDWLRKQNYELYCAVGDCIQDTLEKQSTAYYIDKVVEELEKSSKLVNETNEYCDNDGNDYIPLSKAIEIVKQGCVSDDCCEWESDYGFISDKYKRETQCGYTFYDLHHAVAFKYCPYCGKKIKVVE